MNSPVIRTAWIAACLAAGAFAAEETAGKSHMKEVLRARLAEDAKKSAPAPAPPTASAATGANADKTAAPAESPLLSTDAAAASTTPPVPPPAKKDGAAKTVPTKDQPATVLPKVEVRRSRITELDRQFHEQEKEIAREKKNTQPTELDKALNDSKVSKALSIFGGESNQYRANVAKERVSMMEEEKDLLEAIARAKTTEEKQDLQKQLDEIRSMRRQLEKSLK